METNLDRIIAILKDFIPISLDEMSGIQLMNRLDTKYILPVDTLAIVLRLASLEYRVQDVNNERNIPYHTIYMDTDDQEMFRTHQNGRVVREKIRMRTYVSSNLTFLEVKNKNNKGRTDKKRIQIPGFNKLPVEEADRFLSLYAWYRWEQLTPQLENKFDRITLVNHALSERLTIDTGISFRNLNNGNSVSLPYAAVVELKRDGRCYSPIHETLHALHIRPVSFSKYCMGCVLTDEELKGNRFKPKVRKLYRIRKMNEVV